MYLRKKERQAIKRKAYETKKAYVFNILGNKCAVCGDIKELEIDHIDPKTKSFNINSWKYPINTIEFKTEIKKCQLLCAKHHMEKSLKERGQKSAKGTHGSLSSYRWCKCEICTKAHSDYCAEYHRKKKAAKKKRQYRRRKKEQENK